MTLDPLAAERRIMAEFGERRRIPVLNIEEGDASILIAGPILGLILGSLLGGGILLVPLMAAGLCLGALTVYAAPSHLTALAWLRAVLRYALVRPRVTRSHSTAESPAATGARLGWTPLVSDETTVEMTGIERVWVAATKDDTSTGPGAIQRADGVMQAFIEIRPSNMDFAMSGDWATVHSIAEHFVNTEVDFPLTFHATTRAFPVETMVERIDARLCDADVQASPVLHSLLSEYRERRPRDLAGRQELRYYLGVEVTHLNVYTRYEQEPTPGEKLVRIPLLGLLFTPFVTRRERYDQVELRAAMFEKLDARVRVVEREFIEKVPGWVSVRLDAVETLCLAGSFWTGEELSISELPDSDVLGRDARRSD
jgi:hypothetical protein